MTLAKKIKQAAGLACAVPAIMGARTIESWKDRMITIFVTPLMSCSARLPVYVVFSAALFGSAGSTVVWAMYVLGTAVALGFAALLSKRLKSVQDVPGVLELPPYRLPSARVMWKHGANRTGRPFTGDHAGVLLFETLARFGLTRGTYDARVDDGFELDGAIIVNAVKCLPPENKPTPLEIHTCRPFLDAQLTALPNVRVVVALGAALLVLGAVAGRVSKRLARPLEHLAQTAERFGSGDLTARTGIETLPRRWVAEEVRDVGRAFDGLIGAREARLSSDPDILLAELSAMRWPDPQEAARRVGEWRSARARALRSPSSRAGSGWSRLYVPALPQQISASTSSRSSTPGMSRRSRRGWSRTPCAWARWQASW